ncbi:uncharacterized protein SAPINGB_P003952 [Magnusiomyces paraingens]|uniref:Uncharacterized protein n=1 Tax=Magnusiomyces paraingens TaxID=2606893 RepID=A0A5E8BT27_9ASCO|nr:uncharacterized protein SAPINGB_P003952 [Saprochaete ingens]VVT54191.1 unnamed protein product [Saprochaete ingens]
MIGPDPMSFEPGYIGRRECSSTSTFGGQLGLRISSVPVVFVASLIGVMFPLVSSRVRRLNMPPMVYFFAKYFGSGVIIGTSFVHLLYEAMTSLSDPCLPKAFHEFPYSIGIALVGIFFTFWIEIITRFSIRKKNGGKNIPHTHGPSGFASSKKKENEEPEHNHNHHPHDHPDLEYPSVIKVEETFTSSQPDSPIKEKSQPTPLETTAFEEISPQTSISQKKQIPQHIITVPQPSASSLSPPSTELPFADTERLRQLERTATVNAEARLSTQVATICLLEFGIVFHSIFVGLTLAVTNQSFATLYVVICFHQMFEGMGLGSRLAETPWSERNAWVPWVFAIAFAITTPLGISVGLAVRNTYPPGSARSLITNGVFDSISAGILIYTSLVELMGAEFLHSEEFEDASLSKVMLAFGFMCLGCGLMSMLGRWA